MNITDVTVERDLKAAPRSKAAAAPAAASAAEPAPDARQVPAAPAAPVDKIESVTRQIDTFLRSINRSLQFRVDESTGRTIVSIVDPETGEVLRQVPGEEALRIAQSLENSLSGMLDIKA